MKPIKIKKNQNHRKTKSKFSNASKVSKEKIKPKETPFKIKPTKPTKENDKDKPSLKIAMSRITGRKQTSSFKQPRNSTVESTRAQ